MNRRLDQRAGNRRKYMENMIRKDKVQSKGRRRAEKTKKDCSRRRA